MIVGFAGKKRSGKSTAAETLVKAGFVRYSFAKPIKEMVADFLNAFGVSAGDLYAYLNTDKEAVIPGLGVSARHLMQTLGTEWGRQCVHPDVWVMCAKSLFEHWPENDFVVDDLRFENEAALIRQMGGMVIHIVRPGLQADDNHASEAGIEVAPGDVVISNESSVDVLIYAVCRVVGIGVCK